MKKLILAAALFCGAVPVESEEFRLELLSKKVAVSFSPEKAFFIVDYQDQTVSEYQALLIPPLNKSEADLNLSEWIAGTYVKSVPGNSPVSYSIFLKGKQNEALLLPAVNIEGSGSQPYSNSPDLMKQQIGIRKKILESLQVQNTAQAANLKRLRADAEVIANLSRIVEIVEESEVVKSEIENLDKDLELLRATFQAVRNMPQPKNYARREVELTKQSDEFLRLVKETETSEESRKNLSQADMQRKLKLIEETRYEDEEKLKQQLVRLKQGLPSNGSGQPPAHPEEVKNYWETQ